MAESSLQRWVCYDAKKKICQGFWSDSGTKNVEVPFGDSESEVKLSMGEFLKIWISGRFLPRVELSLQVVANERASRIRLVRTVFSIITNGDTMSADFAAE